MFAPANAASSVTFSRGDRAACRHRGIASRALTHRLSSTWWSWVGSPDDGSTDPSAMLVRTSMFFRKVSLTMRSMSRMHARRPATGTRRPSTPRAKDSTCWTMSAPRRALVSSVARMSSRSGSRSCSLSMPIDIMIGVSTLFRSWAMPPASVPMLSSRCARRNCCSSFVRSVMSVLMTSTAVAPPASSRTSVQRLSTVRRRPSLPTCRSSPIHSPCSSRSAHRLVEHDGIGLRDRARPCRAPPRPSSRRAARRSCSNRSSRASRSRTMIASCALSSSDACSARRPCTAFRSSIARSSLTTARFVRSTRRDEEHGEEAHHQADERRAEIVARTALRRREGGRPALATPTVTTSG